MCAQGVPDSLTLSKRFIHRLDAEARPGYIIPTNSFLKGENENWKPIRQAFSAHLRYSFQFHPHSMASRIFGGAYQGVGLAYYSFGDSKQLGNPLAVYLFQGARLARFSNRLSLNYEWNFGLSFGWKPYDYFTNYYNKVIGSSMNAYLNANVYLNWTLSPQFDLATGVTLTHFSNGNTKFPNAGLNTTGLKLGLVYHFDRNKDCIANSLNACAIPLFHKHVSYDLVLFGSWRRKGFLVGNEQIASPEAYTVLGFNFAPMYNFGYKFRAGVSLDGFYDASANIYRDDYVVGYTEEFKKPSFDKQIALGLSGRAEYVMPYFSVGIGLGANVLHKGGDLKAFYQILALKVDMTRNSFLHIGYSLHNFHTPNFLMLGVGFRFNNKYPSYLR